jgi:hypothetical protein
LPNSEAEMAAYGKAMAEYAKEMARYNEAIGGQNRTRTRGPKRSHHGPSQSGNGNGNYNSTPDDPDEADQHRERARSLQGSQLLSLNMANPIGQASPNSVSQTLPVTFAGRRQLPNSEAELAAHSKAMAGYNKEKAKYDEAVEYHGRSRSLKRSHPDHSTNNGNSEASNVRERALTLTQP